MTKEIYQVKDNQTKKKDGISVRRKSARMATLKIVPQIIPQNPVSPANQVSKVKHCIVSIQIEYADISFKMT